MMSVLDTHLHFRFYHKVQTSMGVYHKHRISHLCWS